MRKYVAEFIGTFVLTFVSCGAAAISGGIDGVLGILGIAAAFGLSIVAMAYSIGNISGCHINPAVSLAMLISKRMDGKDFVGYVIAQVLGGLAAAGILKAVGSMCDPVITGLGTNGYGEASSYLTIGNSKYYASSLEIGDNYVYAAVPAANVGGNRLPLTIASGLTSLVSLVIIFMLLTFSRKESRSAGEEKINGLSGKRFAKQQREAAGALIEDDEEED